MSNYRSGTPEFVQSTISRRVLARRGLGLASTIVAGLLPSQGHPQATKKPHTFRLGVATWLGYGSAYVARDREFFRGVDVAIQRSDDPNVFNAAMLRGDIDGYCTTLDNFVVSAAGGLPGQIVYLFDESAGADGMIVRPGINSFADLRGKEVAAQAGFPSHFFLLYLMRDAGISSSDYKLINLDADKAGAAFVSGRLDAAVTWEPWLSQAREQGRGKLLATSRDYPGLIVDALIAHPIVIRERPEAVRSLVAGLNDAVDFWKASRNDANLIIARNLSLKPEAVEQMVAGVHFLDRSDNRLYLKPQGRAAQTLSFASQIWKDANFITNTSDLSQAINNSFVN